MLKITKFLLVFLLVTIISSVSLLFSGIKVDSFSFGNLNVSQFYIKLDKKLIVDIENIEYKSKKSKVKNSYEDLKKNIDLLPKVLKIFKRIHVERLIIDGNEFTVELNEEALYLDNKFINVSSKVDFLANQVVFDLYSLHLKDIELMVNGKLKIDYFNEKISHFGKYYYKEIEGDVKLDLNEKEASFYLNSKEFESLKFLKKFFRLDSVAEAWMYDNVKGNIKLNEFYGKVDLINNKLLEESLKGSATINKAQITFNKKVKPIQTKKVDVTFEKDTLSFFLDKPVHRGIKLDGSKVIINNLTSEKKGEVVVDIKAVHRLDNKVLDILKAYDIKLPLIQEDGITDARLTLKIPYSIKKSMKTNGKFLVKNANIKIDDFKFYSKKANVILDGSIVKVKNAHFKHKEMIDANVNISIDTKTLKSVGNTTIKRFLVETKKDKILDIKNKKTAIEMDFNNPVQIYLKDLSTSISIADLISVDISNLGLLYSYSKLLQDISIKDGKLSLSIKDENDITFNGFVTGLAFPILKEDKQVSSLNIKGKIRGNITTVTSRDGNIKVNIKDDDISIKLKDHTILVNRDSKENKDIPKLNLEGENIDLKIDNDIYKISYAKAKINNEKVSFSGEVYDLDVPIKKNKKDIKSFKVEGFVSKGVTSISTLDKKIRFKLENSNKMNVFLDGYDLYIDSQKDNALDDLNNIDVEAKNSNIYLNEKYKFLADNYEVRLRKDTSFFHLSHNKSDITYKKSNNGKIDVFANDISSEFVNAIFDKEILKGGKLMLLANGPDNDLKGKLLVTNVNIEDLAVLNNLLLFIHSSPALINPFLAVPSVVGMASNKGFNLTGYKVIDGVIEFVYNRQAEKLNISRLVTVGNGIDFEGNGVVNLKDLSINSKVKLIFFKDYSKLVGAIPVVNYVLLGSNKRVETKVNIFGPLNNPKLSTNLTKDAFSVPVNIGKRILTSPVKFLEFIQGKEKNKQENKK